MFRQPDDPGVDEVKSEDRYKPWKTTTAVLALVILCLLVAGI